MKRLANRLGKADVWNSNALHNRNLRANVSEDSSAESSSQAKCPSVKPPPSRISLPGRDRVASRNERLARWTDSSAWKESPPRSLRDLWNQAPHAGPSDNSATRLNLVSPATVRLGRPKVAPFIVPARDTDEAAAEAERVAKMYIPERLARARQQLGVERSRCERVLAMRSRSQCETASTSTMGLPETTAATPRLAEPHCVAGQFVAAQAVTSFGVQVRSLAT